MSVTHWGGSVPHLQPTTKLKPVLFLVGLILLITAGMMLLPMSVDLYYGSEGWRALDRKSTRLNSSHVAISYAVFCLKKKKENKNRHQVKAYHGAGQKCDRNICS